MTIRHFKNDIIQYNQMTSSAPPTWANLTPIANLVYRVNTLEAAANKGITFSTNGTGGVYSTIDLSGDLAVAVGTPSAYLDMSNGLIMVVKVDDASLGIQLVGGVNSKPYNIKSPIFGTDVDGAVLRIYNSTPAGEANYPAAYGMIQFSDDLNAVIGVVAPQESCRFTYSLAASKWYKIAGL